MSAAYGPMGGDLKQFDQLQAFLEAVYNSTTTKYELRPVPNTPGSQEIASWLSDDIMTEKSVDWWEDRMKDLPRENFSYLGSGNAHHVFLLGSQIYIDCEFVEEQKVAMHSSDFLQLLENYREFLTKEVPEGFSITFSCEGDGAAELFEEEKNRS